MAPDGAEPTTSKIGPYQIELRVPEEGLFAGQAIDVEFRLSDLTKQDPIEGFRGIPNASPTATVTMPEMPGMPVVKPHVHSEGVPGDYGLELFFPHGGDYKIGIRLTPPGAKPIFAAFTVSVKDADARPTKPQAAPYKVELLGLPKDPKAGTVHLQVAIKDTKTRETVKRFDESHTKPIHLILVSKDLGWFAHEHPIQQPDGTFTMDMKFPAGGDYLVFADVAPKDKGSQVLGTKLHLSGPAGAWPKGLVRSRTARQGGIIGTLVADKLPVGSTTQLAFRLRDAATGRPVTDLQPYLGAMGHLIVVHRDGNTFVHSHPSEGAASDALAKRGEVRFNARFPRVGVYKAWAQFQRKGKVVTLPFVMEVGK
jgi:hypothetical protein